MHPIERARERYGIDLTREDVETIRQACMTGKALLLSRPNEISKIFAYRWGGVVLLTVLRNESELVTFLPKDHFQAGSFRANRKNVVGKAGRATGGRKAAILRNRERRRADAAE